MTVYVRIGRRVPKSWLRRTGHTIGGLLTFQENIWLMIKQSLNLARKKANASKKLKFNIQNEIEQEDLNYNIEWVKVIIQGTPAQEEEEYQESLKLYQPLNKIFKKDMPKDDRMMKHFKTKVLSTAKIDEAYKKGYGAMSDNNISNKLLEMGILTHIELDKDYDTRHEDFKTDF